MQRDWGAYFETRGIIIWQVMVARELLVNFGRFRVFLGPVSHRRNVFHGVRDDYHCD